MRPDTNNEIDLLLRRLGRREGATTPAADHLDADELSSYAENALPAAARARYTEHLAECSRCRELVVQLSSSVGVVAAEETAKALPASGFRKFLASLFSPLVLRYAVPAMGLIVVAAIGFIVLRSNRSETLVAQLERPDQNQPAAAAVPNEQSPTPASGRIAEGYGTRQKPQPKTPNEAPAPAPATANAPPPATTDRAEPKAPAPTPTLQPQGAGNAAPAQATPKPAEAADMRVDIESRAAQPGQGRATTDFSKQRSSEAAKTEQKKDEGQTTATASSRPAKAAPSSSPQRGRVMGLMRDGEAEKDKDDGETRTVGGRSFRKQRGVWVDTAYSGSETTNISRGSEQYRALIADEPGIKSIVEQLAGPIIVVWRGRAYRIR